jgi:hypothetical protein
MNFIFRPDEKKYWNKFSAFSPLEAIKLKTMTKSMYSSNSGRFIGKKSWNASRKI